MTGQLRSASRWVCPLLPLQPLLLLLLAASLPPATSICEDGVTTGLGGRGSSTYNTITYCPLNISSGADANIFPVNKTCTNGAIPDWSFQLIDVTPGTPSKYTWGYIYHDKYLMIGEDVLGVSPAYAWVDADVSIQLAHIAIHCSTWLSGQPPCLANVALVLACPLVSAPGSTYGPTAPSDEPEWTCAKYPEQCKALGIPNAPPPPAPTPPASLSPPSNTDTPSDSGSDDGSTDSTVFPPPPPGGGVSTYFNYTKQLGGQSATTSGGSSSKSKKISVWIIVGAVIGGLLVLIIIEEVVRNARNKRLEKKRIAAEEVVAAQAVVAPPVPPSGGQAAAGAKPSGLRSRINILSQAE
ncbi:hypothetical protein KFL_001900030 [Klebsormidium nitens]|uniref:Chitin-binding type-4 domain-containing protein n=1 Tax=Klebsormidium nitens TaxID=105231 RepID=A0A1Y1I0J6_KLENI|nr:hypothetical protein KFL_001900030 [Klebsormidium nitens]|eukprot:GAQ84460.1 hypothetical protein KFL_001900030 [Klebsormidium nitens]